MSTKVVVYLGPARSGKTCELVRHYRQSLQSRRPVPESGASPTGWSATFNRALWLAPNASTADLVRGQLLRNGLDACLAPGVVTFDKFTSSVLAESLPPPRLLRSPLQRELLQRLVRDAMQDGRLKLFAAAAQRSGFIDQLAEHFRELTRRDISPSAYQKVRHTRGDGQHAELADLYAAYSQHLADHGFVDSETAHAAARDTLAARPCRQFQDLGLVVVDGFTDFTPIQHDILQQLAERTEQLLISLPEDDSGSERVESASDRPAGSGQPDSLQRRGRPDLFAKTAETLAELRRHHKELAVRRFTSRASDWPALDYLVRSVFRHPREIAPPPSEALETLNRLEIIAAAGAQDEIVEVARRIKQRLSLAEESCPTGAPSPTDSTPRSRFTKPGDIVVVFRSLAEAAPRVREVFERFGIPFYMGSERPLLAAPVVTTLLALLRLDAEDWPFRRVVSLVTNHSLTAVDAAARQAADWLVRELQIAQGRKNLLDRVGQLAAASATTDQPIYAQRRASQAQLAKPVLDRLEQAIDKLPQEATPDEWCRALSQAGATLGLLPFSDTMDIAAWQSIERHFAELQRLDSWLGVEPRRLSRRELIGKLVEVARHESLPRAHDDVGRVRVLPAPAARNIVTRHLFLVGMSEQAFPSPERAGRLATQADYRLIARTAIRGRAATKSVFVTRSQEEMLLFYEVLSRAEETITISYPALDDKAQSLPPSPYVLEIERVLGADGLEQIRRTVPHLSPVPRPSTEPSPTVSTQLPAADGPLSLMDWRIQAVAEALEGDPRLLAGLFSASLPAPTQALAQSLDAGVRIVHARAHGDSFGPAEGLLATPEVADRLAHRFGPQHLWSPSQWETYAACPFKFYLQSVLGLEPLGDLVLETDFARRGSRLHDVLAAFYRQWSGASKKRSMTVEEEANAFLEHLHKVVDERFAPSHGAGIDAALLELDCRQIRKWAANHFDHYRQYSGTFSEVAGALSPKHFEFRFGPPRANDDDRDPHSTDDAFVLEVDGEPIRITGQIDRIDVATIDGKACFNVIDYKSGKKVGLTQEQIETGERLQLPIYVEAAQALVFGGNAEPLAAGYWSMADGFDVKGALAAVQDVDKVERWKNAQAAVRYRVRQFIDAIRHGDFPVASRDDKCTSYCEFHTVCRVTQIRSLRKTWSPEAEKLQPPAPSR